MAETTMPLRQYYVWENVDSFSQCYHTIADAVIVWATTPHRAAVSAIEDWSDTLGYPTTNGQVFNFQVCEHETNKTTSHTIEAIVTIRGRKARPIEVNP